MSYNPYARYRYGGELYHGRKKISEGGARNGYSNTPGYIAKGKKSPGVWINGKLVYPDQQSLVDTKVKSYLNNQKAADAKADYFMSTKIGKSTLPKDAILYRTIDQKGVVNPKNTLDKALGKNFVRTNIRSGEASRRRQAYNRSKRQLEQQRQAMSLNKQNQGIGGLLRRATNTVGKAAGNWLRGRANDVGKVARGAAKNAYNAIGNAWDGKAGKGSAKDDATAYNRYANDLRALQSGSRSLKTRQAYVRAANRASSAYDNSIKGRLESAGRAISGAGRSAGNWLNERRRDIGNAARGAANAIGNAWDGKAGKGSAKDDAYEYFRQGQDGTDQEGFREMDRYNRSIKGRLESAGKAVSKAARGASKFVSDRANDVGTAARGAAGKVRDTVSGAARDAGKFVSDRAGDVRRTANKARRAAEEAWDGKAGKGSAKDDAAKYRQRGLSSKDPNMKKIDFELGDKAAKKYSNSIKGQIENAPKNISKAVKGIGEKISSTASNASKKVGETAYKAAKNLNTQVGKVTSEINRVKDSVSAGVNYDKIQQDYQNMYVQYRQLQMRDSKAAKAMEPQMDAMRKAYLEMQRNYNSSSLGKTSRDAADFVSSVTGSKRKKK